MLIPKVKAKEFEKFGFKKCKDEYGKNCTGCKIASKMSGMHCDEYMDKYPKQAVAIVEKWSEEHPPETRLTRLLKNYPNTPLNDDGIPDDICASYLGLMDMDDCDDECVICWNMPIEEE